MDSNVVAKEQCQYKKKHHQSEHGQLRISPNEVKSGCQDMEVCTDIVSKTSTLQSSKYDCKLDFHGEALIS